VNVPSDVGGVDATFVGSTLLAEMSLAKPKKMLRLFRRMLRLNRVKESS
jgi:hypothetical protein